MKADEFDKRFDAGEDVTPDLDLPAARRPFADAADNGGLPLPAAERAELDGRLEDLERDPDSSAPWDAVRSRIEKRLDGRSTHRS